MAALSAGAMLPAASAQAASLSSRQRIDIRVGPFDDEVVLGDPAAPATVIEYLSPACPHCARWHRDVFPAVKTDLIETGRVRWVLREFATAMLETCYRTFLLARYVDEASYLPVIEAVMAEQDAMFRSHEVEPTLRAIAERFGVDGHGYDVCMNDWISIANVVRRSDGAVHEAHIVAAPTFVVGDQELPGSNPTVAVLVDAIKRQAGG